MVDHRLYRYHTLSHPLPQSTTWLFVDGSTLLLSQHGFPCIVRLNNIDSYQAYPTFLDPTFPQIPDDERPPKIPIVRVFGATDTGQKVCAHIHGTFLYPYVEYPGKGLMPEDRKNLL